MSLTDVDRAEILVRYRNGQSARQLAGRFAVSPTTIERVIPAEERRTGPWQPRELPLTEAELIRLRDVEGWSWGRLAARTGMTRGGILRRYRAACRRRDTDS